MAIKKRKNLTGSILIKIKPYLASLEAQEGYAPAEKRRHVPTLTELAEVTGLHPVSFSSIANNRVKRLNLDILAIIILSLRESGFNTQIQDLLQYVEQ
jgi:hypothetical protein